MGKLLINEVVEVDYPKCQVLTRHGERMEHETVEVARSIADLNWKREDVVETIGNLILAAKAYYVANYPNPADVRQMIQEDIETMQGLLK